jgi:hypothetical protein
MHINRVLLLVMLLLFVFSPAIGRWITEDPARWYRPQLVWLALILIVAVSMYRDTRRGN